MNLSVPTLKGIVRKYNLHVKIVGYSKMKKEDLVKALDNHLEVVDGLVMMKKHNMEHVKKDIPVKEKKVMKKKSSKKAKKVMKKESSKKAEKVKAKKSDAELIREYRDSIKEDNSKKKYDELVKQARKLLIARVENGKVINRFELSQRIKDKRPPIKDDKFEKMKKEVENTKVKKIHMGKSKEGEDLLKKIDVLQLKKEVEKSKVVNIKKSKKVDKLFNKINKLSEKIKENNEKLEKQIEKVMEKVPKKQISYLVLLKLHKLYLEIKVEKDEDKKQILILEFNKLADEIGLKSYNLENWDDVFHKHLGTKKPQENQKDIDLANSFFNDHINDLSNFEIKDRLKYIKKAYAKISKQNKKNNPSYYSTLDTLFKNKIEELGAKK